MSDFEAAGMSGPKRQQAVVSRRSVVVMSQYMAWPTADGVWHIGTGLTLPRGASLADLNEFLELRFIDRAQIGFHRPNDEIRFNEQFAPSADSGGH
jgi:hypothetical protein